MQVNKNNVAQFLAANNTTFVIPVYQRNYDWTEENCKQLWSDIWYVAQGEDGRTHFLGTICSKGITSREKTIIDGQQRITTITLLLKAMHDYVENDDFKRDIEATFLRNMGYGVSENHKVKLHLNRRDDVIYRKLLESFSFCGADGLTKQEKESSVYQNYAFFYNQMKGLEEGQIASIRAALDRIVIVDLDVEGEDPQEIFESLNSTGLDLTDVDLLRNYLLMSLDYENQLRLYNEYWYKIEENVNPRNMVRFFIDYLIYVKRSDAIMIRGRRAHINEGNLYTAFKNYYASLAGERERYSNSPEVTEQILKKMLNCSEVYRRLVFDSGIDMNSLGDIDRIIYSLVYLNESVASRPVLLYVMGLLAAGEIAEGQASEMLRACLTLVVRAKVTRSTGINGQFAGNVLQRLPEHGTEDIVDAFWRALTSGGGKFAYPSDEEFREALLNRPIFEVIRAKGVKYLLYALEQSSVSAKGLPRYDDANITIEHIMPKTLSEAWEEELGTEASLHDDYLNKLGNLALTSYNSEMSNREFGEKRTWYSEASFALTRDICLEESWSIDAIRRRANAIAEECLRVWSMPARYQTEESAEEVSRKRVPFQFSMIGLVPGDEVSFVKNPSLIATVVDDSHVEYQGEVCSLSALAARFLGKETSRGVQGPLHFAYEGETLSQLRNEVDANVF